MRRPMFTNFLHYYKVYEYDEDIYRHILHDSLKTLWKINKYELTKHIYDLEMTLPQVMKTYK